MPLLECIYDPITALGFSAMFTFQLVNTKRKTFPAPHCRNGSRRYVQALRAVIANMYQSLYILRSKIILASA